MTIEFKISEQSPIPDMTVSPNGEITFREGLSEDDKNILMQMYNRNKFIQENQE